MLIFLLGLVVEIEHDFYTLSGLGHLLWGGIRSVKQGGDCIFILISFTPFCSLFLEEARIFSWFYCIVARLLGYILEGQHKKWRNKEGKG